MTLRWVDDNSQVVALPRQRRAFYQQIEQRLQAHDPTALPRIEAELRTSLDDVSSGRADCASVERNAGADWNGFERQAIYEATQSWDHSRWWCGLLLMRLAIAHAVAYICYKPGEGSEVSTAYFPDRRHIST